jgi:hypothetical protein
MAALVLWIMASPGIAHDPAALGALYYLSLLLAAWDYPSDRTSDRRDLRPNNVYETADHRWLRVWRDSLRMRG